MADHARLLLLRLPKGSAALAEARRRRKRRRWHLKWEKQFWRTWSKGGRERPCRRCGHCCSHVQFPPFKLTLPEVEKGADSERPPDEAIAEIRLGMERLGHQPDDYDLDQLCRPTPCLWFEERTGLCRWYPWRPLLCQKFACPQRTAETNGQALTGGDYCWKWSNLRTSDGRAGSQQGRKRILSRLVG